MLSLIYGSSGATAAQIINSPKSMRPSFRSPKALRRGRSPRASRDITPPHQSQNGSQKSATAIVVPEATKAPPRSTNGEIAEINGGRDERSTAPNRMRPPSPDRFAERESALAAAKGLAPGESGGSAIPASARGTAYEAQYAALASVPPSPATPATSNRG